MQPICSLFTARHEDLTAVTEENCVFVLIMVQIMKFLISYKGFTISISLNPIEAS